MHLSMLCRGGGSARGGDLIVFVGPGVGHLTDLVLPGEGIFESSFARHAVTFPLRPSRLAFTICGRRWQNEWWDNSTQGNTDYGYNV